jgi:hypothetical protein
MKTHTHENGIKELVLDDKDWSSLASNERPRGSGQIGPKQMADLLTIFKTADEMDMFHLTRFSSALEGLVEHLKERDDDEQYRTEEENNSVKRIQNEWQDFNDEFEEVFEKLDEISYHTSNEDYEALGLETNGDD